MDLAIIGRPQDSRISLDSFNLDLRANSISTINGEKIVLRLLKKDQSFKISESKLPRQTIEILSQCIRMKNGLILIAGPTGSGKTTTLYSLLNLLDRNAKNISTIEDPVEYEFPGFNQVNIDHNKTSFASALRAMMRQDPDVILVGEIRDEETANLSIKASSTGHLVLSTIHANGAKEVLIESSS